MPKEVMSYSGSSVHLLTVTLDAWSPHEDEWEVTIKDRDGCALPIKEFAIDYLIDSLVSIREYARREKRLATTIRTLR